MCVYVCLYVCVEWEKIKDFYLDNQRVLFVSQFFFGFLATTVTRYSSCIGTDVLRKPSEKPRVVLESLNEGLS